MPSESSQSRIIILSQKFAFLLFVVAALPFSGRCSSATCLSIISITGYQALYIHLRAWNPQASILPSPVCDNNYPGRTGATKMTSFICVLLAEFQFTPRISSSRTPFVAQKGSFIFLEYYHRKKILLVKNIPSKRLLTLSLQMTYIYTLPKIDHRLQMSHCKFFISYNAVQTSFPWNFRHKLET